FRVDQARVNLERTVVRAPIDGVVAKRSVQAGQMVQPGTPLMAVVPVQQAYVDANFKEVQLGKVRVGQTATLTSDLYGDKVVYHGRVIGFSGGTGAA
ncbi:HlyD family efflux transporter periplasmic adaptor subunit, partial [Clostridioides difficile]|uniref:HlyD family efflux transporter periplasmic adaptor subunit n=1 Tax=Clostridioides difficile TaxID=1496 RepID=UPI0018DC75D9